MSRIEPAVGAVSCRQADCLIEWMFIRSAFSLCWWSLCSSTQQQRRPDEHFLSMNNVLKQHRYGMVQTWC